jgi:hypothetical protein
MSSLTTTCLGVSNGSAALAITRAFRANRESMFAWRSSLFGGRTHSVRDCAPLKRKERSRSVLACLLPYISIASVWQKRRPVVTHLAAYRHCLRIDTPSCRMLTLGELRSSPQRHSQKHYLFGPSWPHVRRPILVAMEQDGDPHAVMVPAVLVSFFF